MSPKTASSAEDFSMSSGFLRRTNFVGFQDRAKPRGFFSASREMSILRQEKRVFSSPFPLPSISRFVSFFLFVRLSCDSGTHAARFGVDRCGWSPTPRSPR